MRFLSERSTLERRNVTIGWLIYASLAAATLAWFVARGLTEGASDALAGRMALAMVWYGAFAAALWAWGRHVRGRADATAAALRQFEAP